ncbi:hypothetical protein BTR23_14250 [Alkalihalophilus pseudofirmus]|nr:hypothetical protein BTR23_14250 [Alkalihalophilus pseudofirmus]
MFNIIIKPSDRKMSTPYRLNIQKVQSIKKNVEIANQASQYGTNRGKVFGMKFKKGIANKGAIKMLNSNRFPSLND